MTGYLEQYFKILINTEDIEQIKEFLPTITLNFTDNFLDLLIEKLRKEIEVALECEDFQYEERLSDIISLLDSKKKVEVEEVSVLTNNVIVFSDEVLKNITKLNDKLFYQEIKVAIECLESKEWMEVNKNNTKKYRRLHGGASGLSEVKTTYIRLMHVPINSDFWYVVGIIKKDGDWKRGTNCELTMLRDKAMKEADDIRKMFTKNGELDIISLNKFAIESSGQVYEELDKWGGKKNGIL